MMNFKNNVISKLLLAAERGPQPAPGSYNTATGTAGR